VCECDILTHRLLPPRETVHDLNIGCIYIGMIIIYDAYLMTRFADSILTAVCSSESPTEPISSGPTTGAWNEYIIICHRRFCLHYYRNNGHYGLCSSAAVLSVVTAVLVAYDNDRCRRHTTFFVGGVKINVR